MRSTARLNFKNRMSGASRAWIHAIHAITSGETTHARVLDEGEYTSKWASQIRLIFMLIDFRSGPRVLEKPRYDSMFFREIIRDPSGF